jgi:hypothetical protein
MASVTSDRSEGVARDRNGDLATDITEAEKGGCVDATVAREFLYIGVDRVTAITAAMSGGVVGDRKGELATEKTAGARGCDDDGDLDWESIAGTKACGMVAGFTGGDDLAAGTEGAMVCLSPVC